MRTENGKIVRGDASAEQRDYRNELALLCSWLRELADQHPGCVNCMKAETTVEPGKYCPDCGRRAIAADQEKP